MAHPLTKKTQNGQLYTRPANIEASIEAANVLELDDLKERAWINNSDSPRFLPLECLVYFIRQARRTGDEKSMSALMPPLLHRSMAILRAKVPTGCLPNAEDVREEILGEFAVLFAEDGAEGSNNFLDFYECKFNAAFRKFRAPFIDREKARTEPLIALPGPDSMGDCTDEEYLSKLSVEFQQPANQFDHALRQSLLRVIATLPQDQCKAATLYYIYGYPIESNDTSERTVASCCGVTPRTIRNWLAKAESTITALFKPKERHAHEVQ